MPVVVGCLVDIELILLHDCESCANANGEEESDKMDDREKERKRGREEKRGGGKGCEQQRRAASALYTTLRTQVGAQKDGWMDAVGE